MTSGRPPHAEVLDAEAVPPDQPQSWLRDQATGNGDFMIYSFTLSPAGTVTGPAEVPGGVITGQSYLALDGGFAVSLDGTELAIATADPAAKGIPLALAEQIVLINTRTGARATWKGGLVHGRLSGGHLVSLPPKAWEGQPVSW